MKKQKRIYTGLEIARRLPKILSARKSRAAAKRLARERKKIARDMEVARRELERERHAILLSTQLLEAIHEQVRTVDYSIQQFSGCGKEK